MSGALDTLLHLEAADTGLVQQRASKLHRHVQAQPMAVAVYKLAGDAASPIAILYGTARDRRRLLVAPEPRSREIRFDLLNTFMPDVLVWAQSHGDETAPQLLVANPATAAFLGILGRSLRHPRTDGSIPLETVLGARHLAWMAERQEHPGASVIVPLTEVLAGQWRTGQSDLEDAQLPTLLAWIDPADGLTGRDAAAVAERARRTTTSGPATDPGWDEQLDVLLREFNQRRAGATDPATVRRFSGPIEDLVREALDQAWDDLWHGHELLVTLPSAASAAGRWADDVREWHRWRDYAEGADARIANTDSARRAAWMLDSRERTQAALDIRMAIDDPLRFAALEADGHALRGEVVTADYARRVIPAGKVRNVVRPLLLLQLDGPVPVRVGASVWSADDTRVSGVVHAVDQVAQQVTIELSAGLNPRTGPASILPAPLETARFTTASPEMQQATPLHSLTDPWTHRRPVVDLGDAAVDTDADPGPVAAAS